MSNVEWRGVDQVNANLTQFMKRMHQGAEEAGETQAKKILAAAQNNAPVDTGELVGSGRTEKKGGTNKEVQVIFDAPHAAVVEKRHASKGRFLRRATESNRTEQGYAETLTRKLR